VICPGFPAASIGYNNAMEWTEDGIVLTARKHGESAVIVTLLTRDHGRHAGLVRGGAGRRARGIYQPGNRVRARWSARLAEHLGTFRCELLRAHAADHLHDPIRLLAVSAATSMAEVVLPERESHPLVFDRLSEMMDRLGEEGWAAIYVRWEFMLLRELGFGLDLTAVAAAGADTGALFVSASSGMAAVGGSGEGGGHERRLRLPAFLLSNAEAPPPCDLKAGLALTAHFLNQRVFHPEHRALPAARTRLVAGLQ